MKEAITNEALDQSAQDTDTQDTQDMPFEIVIRTKSEEFRAKGGPAEMVIPCKGYMLFANLEGKTQISAQGEVNERSVLRGVSDCIDNKRLFMLAALGLLDGKEAPDESE